MNIKLYYFSLLISFSALFSFLSCTKILEIETPKNQLTNDKVFADIATAEAAVVNLYALLEKSQYPVFNKYLGCYAGECYGLNDPEWNQRSIAANNGINQSNWTYLYSLVYQCNSILEQLPLTAQLPAGKVRSFRAEALFMRAYAYFYLVNLYDHIPLVTTTSVNVNKGIKQSDAKDLYTQIVADLITAKAQLPENYIGEGKVRANKWGATALLARVYLFKKNWILAEKEASEVISSGQYSLPKDLNKVFIANSDEAILQLWTQYGYLTDSENMIPDQESNLSSYPLTQTGYLSFEPGDLRRENWTGTSPDGSHYFSKYKNRLEAATNPEYLMVFRLSEQYLIRAEARAEQGKLDGIGGGKEDLDLIRFRAGLQPTAASNLPDMRLAIEQECRSELFLEWGYRFLDLKRRGHMDQALKSTLPIPQNEITFNKNLIQNPQY